MEQREIQRAMSIEASTLARQQMANTAAIASYTNASNDSNQLQRQQDTDKERARQERIKDKKSDQREKRGERQGEERK